VRQPVGRLLPCGERGTTLVEILVALAIIASTLTIFIVALSTGAFGVRTAERLTTANNLAASQLESIKGATYDAAGVYAPIPAPPGYAIAVTSSEVVTGLQQITVTVSLQGETLTTVSNYKVNR
jgi:type II secretory pathway pseudopilin PulG